MKNYYSIFIAAIVGVSTLSAGTAHISVQVERTAYMQWLSTSGSQMTQTNPSGPGVITLYNGNQTAELHLGIMCNSLAGYSVHLQASDATGNNRAYAVGNHGKQLVNMELNPQHASLRSGTQASTYLDLTGSSPSIDVGYATASALPLQAHRPNVFTLRATLSPGEVKDEGAYTSFVTATISLH